MIDNLKNIFKTSEYPINHILLDEYFEFISKNIIDIKPYERHHILPRSLFPDYIKNKNNIIKLSPRNHFLAHYLLAKACRVKPMIFAFNQMKRVLKKFPDIKDIEELANLFQEFKIEHSLLVSKVFKEYYANLSEEEKNILSDTARKRSLGMVSVKYPDGTTKRVSINDPDYVSKKCVVTQTGSKHSPETIEKMKSSNNSLVKGYPFYNPETLQIKYFHKDEVPEGWLSGCVLKNSGKPGANYYYNPETLEQRKFFPDQVPDGWLHGRIDFGQKNPFLTPIYVNPFTKKGEMISKDQEVPKFFHNGFSKNYYFWTDSSGYKWFTSKKKISPNKVDFIIPIKDADFDSNLFNDYQWIYHR